MRAIIGIAKSRRLKPQFLGGSKNHKKSGGKTSILKGQELPSCDFCGRKGHTETACRIKQKAMASAKKYTKNRSAQWKKNTAEKLKPLLQLLQLQIKKIVLVMKMRTTRKKRLLWSLID
jgi:hypothetical protein